MKIGLRSNAALVLFAVWKVLFAASAQQDISSQRVRESVVMLGFSEGGYDYGGSGTMMSPQGYILCNYLVLTDIGGPAPPRV